MTTALPLVYVQLPLTFTNLWYDLTTVQEPHLQRKRQRNVVSFHLLSVFVTLDQKTTEWQVSNSAKTQHTCDKTGKPRWPLNFRHSYNRQEKVTVKLHYDLTHSSYSQQTSTMLALTAIW